MDPLRKHAQSWTIDWLEPKSHALSLGFGVDSTNKVQNLLLEEGKMTMGGFKYKQNVHHNIVRDLLFLCELFSNSVCKY